MKISLKSMAIISCAVLFAGCSGNSLVDTNDDVGQLQVSVVHHLHDGTELAADPDGSKTFITDLGFTVILEEAMVNWKTLKLVSGGGDPECQPGFDQTLDVNATQDYLGEDLISHALAENEISKIAYCAYELTLAPGVSGAAIKNHEGEDHGGGESTFPESFHLAGSWSKDADSGSFHIDTTDPVVISGLFHAMENGVMIEHPLHFHEGEDSADVLFGTKYDLLLDGVDFLAQSEDEQRDQVLVNFTNAVHQHLGATHNAGGH